MPPSHNTNSIVDRPEHNRTVPRRPREVNNEIQGQSHLLKYVILCQRKREKALSTPGSHHPPKALSRSSNKDRSWALCESSAMVSLYWGLQAHAEALDSGFTLPLPV